MKPLRTFCTAFQKPGWLALALGALTFAVFAPSISHEFINYDDGLFVYENATVRQGLSLEGIGYAFRTTDGGSWIPLTVLSHMLNVTLFGLRPAGHHAANVFLHSVAAALTLLVLQRLTGRLWLSAFVAALFAFHPLRNESVAWVAERKDVLSGALWMLGLWTYVRFVENPGAKRYALVLLCLMLGLMAKPMLVTFPFVLLLLDFWPLGRMGRNWAELRVKLWPLFREKLPLLALVVLICGLTLLGQRQVGAMQQPEVSAAQRIAGVVSNYGFYLQKVFWPVRLSILYPGPEVTAARSTVWFALLAGLTAIVSWRAFRIPWAAVGWFWFLGTLAPVVGIVRVGHTAVADRYTYLPAIGIGLMIAWGVAELVRGRKGPGRWAGAIACLVIAACAVATLADLPRWRDSGTLFDSALRTAPHPVAYNNLADFYIARGEYDRAIELCDQLLQLQPKSVKAQANRALALASKGDLDPARRFLSSVGVEQPRTADALNERGSAALKRGDPDEALRDFTSAIESDPKHASAYNNRGSAHLMKGDTAAAIRDCSQAIQLKPGYANAYTTRGSARYRAGDLVNALSDFGKAIELSPEDPLPYNNRAAVYLAMQHYGRAWEDIASCRQRGGQPPPALVEALSHASGRKE